MDRRKQKTREAIFAAFTALLSQKNYHHISVQEIIDAANVGRTTFYAHFETKEYLLKALCEELFGHIIDISTGRPHEHIHSTASGGTGSVFLHLLQHLQENDRNILELLSSPNNELFLKYFKLNLKKLITVQDSEKGLLKQARLPEDYLINHIAATFVETVDWWISHKMKEPPEVVSGYLRMAIEPLL